MKIEIAKTAGFCMGVRRAVELTLNASDQNNTVVYTCGPLIHNPQVLDFFSKKKIFVLKNIPLRGFGIVIIRAHGVPPDVQVKLKNAGFTVVDATCPRVTRVQKIIRTNANRGYTTIIIGDKNHPEVSGLVGYAGSDVYVVCNMMELEALPLFEKAIIVAQTTQNIQFYNGVKKWVNYKKLKYIIFDTICDSTKKRQVEIKLLADRVDVIVVVGGRQSGNTVRLREVAEVSGKPVLHVETELDLYSHKLLLSVKRVGITAGASTPNWIIKKVHGAIKNIVSTS